MTTWTIIGGGLHAVTIAIKLRSLGLKASQLLIIDPNPNLCAQFDNFSQRIDMPYLRSPCVHHVHPDPFHLNQYAKKMHYTNAAYGQYKRPNRNMFMDHTHDLIHSYHLNSCHIQGYVSDIKLNKQQWHMQLNNQSWISSDHVIVAFGCNHEIYVPKLFQNQPGISHIFENEQNNYAGTSHVVGSGISAAHLTLRLLKENSNNQIHLWMNKAINVHDFDADPGWLGPKNMKKFSAMQSSIDRLNTIKNERHKGSMPKELELRLKKYIKEGRLKVHINEITDIINHHICTDNYCIHYDHILLATGFKETIMQQPLIQQLITEYQAPVCSCGLPSITSTLEWLPNLYVSGGLADLELGPFARNIMGGREASLRIGEAFEHKQYNKSQKHYYNHKPLNTKQSIKQ
ncbi:FAD/NAD(P)-binding protein [Staphylococcus xylosus]|uniref:FAD/NAD(P)-binding protein n=1 Tax=Staphylococcus xylosus TaxID=1288 RepID=UPI0015C54E3F|nr:FAD/NAD(P)-binding protein [Staphylococcus xylosus]NQD99236.1 SidA/IucD/PvdA family monooxygenase [Staphylococcus xylosus]